MSCAYRQAAWRRDVNAAITVVISLLTEKFRSTSFLAAGHLYLDDVRWLEDPKLKTFEGVKGNTLAMFVEKVPGEEGVLRAEQREDEVRLPGAWSLEGVMSRSKVVLRMTCVDFKYSKDRPTIVDVYLTVSQVSRVAVVCANGAGESTVIKGLIGEQLPILGSIERCSSLLVIDDIKACTVLRASSLSWMLPVYNASLRRG